MGDKQRADRRMGTEGDTEGQREPDRDQERKTKTEECHMLPVD